MADEGTAKSSHTIDEVSFTEGTADASTISIIVSNNSAINHYAAHPSTTSCLWPRSFKPNKSVTFHQNTNFSQPIGMATSPFSPANTLWPYACLDIDTLDPEEFEPDNDNGKKKDIGNEPVVPEYTTNGFV